MQKRDKILLLVMFLFISSLIIFSIMLYLNLTAVLQLMEIPVTLTIGDHAGFDLNTSILTFGMIPYGSNANRKLTIENNYGIPAKFEFSVQGDISEFLILPKDVVLDPDERREISISTITFSNEPYGNYTGTLMIFVKKNV